MTMTTKPETNLEPPAAEDRGAHGLGNFGLIHLVACLGAGGRARSRCEAAPRHSTSRNR